MTVRTLDDLHREEKLAFLGLLRVLVRVDGEFSREEAQAMHAIARKVGSADFWRSMAESQSIYVTPDQVFEAARGVDRDDVRRFVYDCLLEVASVDGIDPSEEQLLAWLRHEWGLSEP